MEVFGEDRFVEVWRFVGELACVFDFRVREKEGFGESRMIFVFFFLDKFGIVGFFDLSVRGICKVELDFGGCGIRVDVGVGVGVGV